MGRREREGDFPGYNAAHTLLHLLETAAIQQPRVETSVSHVSCHGQTGSLERRLRQVGGVVATHLQPVGRDSGQATGSSQRRYIFSQL